MNPFWIVFLVVPFIALAARDISKRKVSVWSIAIVYVIVGWGLANLAVDWRFSSLAAQAQSSPSPELLDQLQNDGAANVFAYYFGWLYAVIYFLLCLWIYYIARYFMTLNGWFETHKEN